MSDLLVTGGAGFIGANFVRHWRAAHPEAAIVVLDALTYAGNAANLNDLDGVELVRGDIADEAMVASLLRDRALDTIVHFAAESHVDRSISGPDAFVQTNVVGTHALLTAARRVWLEGSGKPHRFHHISTDEVFGSLGPDEPAFHEATPYAPNSPYAASKAASDHLVRACHHTYGLQTSITNCSNNYGPYQFPEKLIPLFLVNALTGKALPIYGDGMNARDWLHVGDHCVAIELVLKNGQPGETYNVGGGVELPNLTVVGAICDAVDGAFRDDPALTERFPDAPAAKGGSSHDLRTFVTDRAGHDRRYAIDERKIARELGYAPQRGFEEGLAETIRWYLANEDWWRAIFDGSYRR
ncbi:MAG: dTDP-glucose 4,6-dehydratase [Sphingomonadaceae bacterium]|nr:dTDP-glucose 4,6-dehydratase [Sphingomonadaceae bacterium]